jgi:hypothetical protein
MLPYRTLLYSSPTSNPVRTQKELITRDRISLRNARLKILTYVRIHVRSMCLLKMHASRIFSCRYQQLIVA